jgi:polar amino acid transport system permease protein
MTARLSSFWGTRRVLLDGCFLLPLLVAGCSSSYQWRPNFFVDSLLRPSPAIINGLWLTVSLSVLAQAIGVVLGAFAAMGKMARFLPFKLIAGFYVWVFRGTPLLVQLSFFYFGFPSVGLFKWPEIVLGPV